MKQALAPGACGSDELLRTVGRSNPGASCCNKNDILQKISIVRGLFQRHYGIEYFRKLMVK
jgi:hypothetical protein